LLDSEGVASFKVIFTAYYSYLKMNIIINNIIIEFMLTRPKLISLSNSDLRQSKAEKNHPVRATP